MGIPLRALIVEDNPVDAELLVRQLHRDGFDPIWKRVDTESEYLSELDHPVDVILSDYDLPSFSGIRALCLLHERGLQIPFILISGTIGEDIAVAAMKEGAIDYLLKDRLIRLGPAIKHALSEARLRQERRQSENALRESEARFRQLAESIEDVFWLADYSRSQFLYISPGYEKIWGRPCIDLYQSSQAWVESIHPDDRERVIEAARTKQTLGTYEEEFRIVRPDGSIRWIRDRAYQVSRTKSEGTRIAGVARDITARKASEDELRESERRFRDLLENIEMIAMILDIEGRVAFCNDYLLRVTGWSRAEVIGADWFALATPDSPEIREMFMSRIGNGNIPRLHENPIRTKGGTLRDIVWNNTILRDASGRISGTASIGDDVTERKLAEKRVREQAAILDHTREAIIMRDIHSGRISFWNKGAEHLYGWTADEAIGREIGELIFVERDAPSRISERLLDTGEWHGELQHVTKGGKHRIISGHATLVRDAESRPTSALIINIDVTEQKNLEAQFLRAQRMESIGTLAAGVAHDLNNILAPILMAVRLLRDSPAPDGNEALVSTIEASAERGAQIVKQVLAFGRGLGGEKHSFTLKPLIDEIVGIISQTFPKDIRIEHLFGSELHPIHGNATQIHQILLNLCVNARDAMPNGGLLRLRASHVDIDESFASMVPDASPGPHVRIDVSDTGTGIPPETLDRIFDPFFSTKGVGNGTGLGLSTVLGIAKSHGGFVLVNSTVGEGTTFQVYLPCVPGQASRPEPEREDALPTGSGELILIVDDESSVREVAQAALESHGFRVLSAQDGASALSIYAQDLKSFAAVITDLMMPNLDGTALAHVLRAIDPDLPIIVSTGLAEYRKVQELEELGVRTLLHKPYTSETLIRTVHAEITRRPRSTPREK